MTENEYLNVGDLCRLRLIDSLIGGTFLIGISDERLKQKRIKAARLIGELIRAMEKQIPELEESA